MDIVTYALLKKKIDSSKTGIKKIEAGEGNTLLFTMADDSVIEVELPQECIVQIDSKLELPLTGNPSVIYIVTSTKTTYIYNKEESRYIELANGNYSDWRNIYIIDCGDATIEKKEYEED